MLRKRLNFCMLGLLLAAVSVALSASSAMAGTYFVDSCNYSGTKSMDGWSFDKTAGANASTPYFFSTDCGAEGLYRAFQNGLVPSGAYEAWTFQAPAGTYIDQATLYQVITPVSPGSYDAIYAELEDGTRRTVANWIGGEGTRVTDSSWSMPNAASHTVRLRTELGCQTTAPNCAGTYNGTYGNEWRLNGSAIRLVDPSVPTFSSVGGEGWKSAPVDGISTVSYSVADQGGGVKNVRFLVDGIEHARNIETCSNGSYVPCPLSSTGTFALDTTLLSEGQHTIAVVGEDWSKNVSAAADKQLSITVRRPPVATSSTPVSTTNPSANGGGSPAVGDQLNGSNGSWSGADLAYTYQWNRCDTVGQNCVAIPGATGINYSPTTADVGKTLQFCVTASNSGGSATNCAAPTAAVIPPRVTSGGGSNALPTSVDGSSPTPVPAKTSPTTTASSGPDRGPANGSGAAEKVVLTALANSRTSSQKVKYGKPVAIVGRLVGPTGAPISGATLAVQVQTAVPGASMADAAQVVTAADGRFKYTAPAGPSRTIRFGYRTYSADTFFADTTDVRLLVSAGVTLKATPKKVRNKHATMFTGRLLGKPISKRGVVVDLQVFFRKQWRTFAAPRTTKAGKFKFKYRFMAGAATWKFRARVRKESSYPYELGYSARQVKVKVTK